MKVLGSHNSVSPLYEFSTPTHWVAGNTNTNIYVDGWNGSSVVRLPLVLADGGSAASDPNDVALAPANWRLPSDFEPDWDAALAELLRAGDVVQENGVRFIVVAGASVDDKRLSPSSSPAYTGV